ncbi:MAG: ABC transporter permease [Bacteroidales bacterium]|jgi:putative ABC transport system permease protein|nr:ABC transporter permease [Bacteroidales bacterium]HOI32002.1 ABC transporter permease [Bacteroidales bacterium]
MWLNYLKIAFRNVLKHKLTAAINIIGLSIGLASFILILMYVKDELSYDRYHQDADQIYRLVSKHDFEGVGEESASAPFPVGPTLLSEYPALIEHTVRVFNFQAPRSLIQLGDKSFNERQLYFADSNFFQLFDYHFIYGNPNTALNESFALVITKETAKKYFGNENPMGKTLRYENQFDLKVSGVIEKVPANSHFHWDMMASLASVKSMYGGRLPQTWVWNPCWTYIKLNEGVEPENLEADFPHFIEKYFYDAMKESITLFLQPLTKIHLHSRLDYEIEPNGNITYVVILSAIAVFLLLIAIINFMNLSTATSSRRAREIGMKKVVGADKLQLVGQFLGEAILMSMLALFLSLLLVEFSLNWFNSLADKNLSLRQLLEPKFAFFLLILGLITGLLSGIYPALYLSSFQPLKVLKGQFAGGKRSGKARKILVAVQFAISIGLIICTLIAFDQLYFLLNADLGFNKSSVIFVPVNRTPIVPKYEAFKHDLEQHSFILSVTALDDIFGVAHNTHEFRPEGFPEDKWQFYPALVVQHDFLKTFEIPIVAGRDYSHENKTDPMDAILINEAMVKHLGWGSNEDALGKKFKSLAGEERVVGVFKDFNATSLHQGATPFVLNIKEEERVNGFFLRYVAVRIAEGATQQAINTITQIFHQYAPGRPFEFSFLSDELNKQYREEERLSRFSLALTILIILVAGLGLFGLVSFMIGQRRREISIRLTLGAGLHHMLALFFKEYILIIAIANLIAWPASWLMLNHWLDNFAYRTNISFTYFLLSALISMILTLLIISWRTIAALLHNPMHVLRSE